MCQVKVHARFVAHVHQKKTHLEAQQLRLLFEGLSGAHQKTVRGALAAHKGIAEMFDVRFEKRYKWQETYEVTVYRRRETADGRSYREEIASAHGAFTRETAGELMAFLAWLESAIAEKEERALSAARGRSLYFHGLEDKLSQSLGDSYEEMTPDEWAERRELVARYFEALAARVRTLQAHNDYQWIPDPAEPDSWLMAQAPSLSPLENPEPRSADPEARTPPRKSE